jgi:hypothetical protein
VSDLLFQIRSGFLDPVIYPPDVIAIEVAVAARRGMQLSWRPSERVLVICADSQKTATNALAAVINAILIRAIENRA